MSERRVEILSVPGFTGWRVEFFRERDQAVAYWYGTREECVARAADQTEPHASYWLRSWSDERSGDAATQTGMYDR